MYILQNSIRNVLRNRGRNALIGAIMCGIIMASVTALMINSATAGIIDDYKGRFGAEVILAANMNKIRARAMANPTSAGIMIVRPVIPPEQYVAFGESEYLQGAYYTASIGINSADITAVDAKYGGWFDRPVAGMGPGGAMPTMYMLRLLGNRFEDFKEGLRALAAGRMPTAKGECIISVDLAELNGLSVGDTLTFITELNDLDRNVYEAYYTLTVVGTYYDATDKYPPGARQNAYLNRRNEVLAAYETVLAPMQSDLRGVQITATYYLKNPEHLEAFAAELYAKGLDEVWDVKTDDATYNKIVGPVEGLRGISISFMLTVLVFGGIIIALLSSIAVRERKYEIGVLRAMGMKKHKVALGLWLEMLFLTVLCLVVGLAAGTAVAQPVTNVLLEYQIAVAQAPATLMPGVMLMGQTASPTAANAQPLRDIDVSLGLSTMLQITVIALLLASLAGLASISQITRYEPIKILMERN